MIVIGSYDVLPKGSQVKCWTCEMESLKVGDSVNDFGLPEYIVLLREGGYVRVKGGIITKIVENRGRLFYYPGDFEGIPCFDKWGNRVNSADDLAGQFQGLVEMFRRSDPYYFKEVE